MNKRGLTLPMISAGIFITLTYAGIANGAVSVTIGSNPTGQTFTVDGTTYASTQIFNWTTGSLHAISTVSPQSGTTGTRYVFDNWSDAGAQSHTYTVPSTNATLTAAFTTQYLLTMSSQTGGTVSPASGWYNSGQSITISVTANSDYTFSNWTGSGSGSYSGTASSANITMNEIITQSASFALKIPAMITLSTPANQDTIRSDSVILAWEKPGVLVRHYWLEISNDSTMAGATIDSTISDTAKVLKNLINNKTYWWRVRAGNESGWGQYSSQAVFFVRIPLTSTRLPVLTHIKVHCNGNLRYTIGTATPVSIRLYSMSGRQVYSSYQQCRQPGLYSVSLPVHSIPSGYYILDFRANGFASKIRLLITTRAIAANLQPAKAQGMP